MRRGRRDGVWIGLAAGVLLFGGAAACAVGLRASDELAGRAAAMVRWGVRGSLRALDGAGVHLHVAALDARTSPAGGEPQEADFSWSGHLAAGQVLEVVGVNGPVTAVASDDGLAAVRAHKSARHSDPSEVRIEVVESSQGVTLCAVYPGHGNRCEPGGGHSSIHGNDVKVAFQVRVPAGVRFHGRTVNGHVDAQGLDAEVDATSVNGGVDVSTTGPASATTVNGSIHAAFGALTSAVHFKTVNGAIDLDVPDDAGANVDASWVNGGLKTSLPLKLVGSIGRRHAEGSLGGGGPRLELKTVNGAIRIH